MKKALVGMVLAVAMVVSPIISSAEPTGDFKPVKIAPRYEVVLSDVTSSWMMPYGSQQLKMTLDDKKNQKRVPLIDDIMDIGISYRIPKDGKIARKKAISPSGYPSYIDTVETNNYTMVFTIYSDDVKDFAELTEEMEAKYGASGWADYYVDNTVQFFEKVTNKNAVVYGSIATDSAFFELSFIPKKGKKVQSWWTRNVMQGLEFFIMRQELMYAEMPKFTADYISTIEVEYRQPNVVLPDYGEFRSNEFYPGRPIW